MFCRKLKDLKITGECPFSVLTPGQVPKEPAEEVAGGSDSCKATPPICQDVPEKNVQGDLPQRKTSRSRVYLHTLAESICKLIFPEFEQLNLALQRTLAKHKIKESRKSLEREDFEKIIADQAIAAGVPVEIIKESLGEELFKICYEEDEQILGVVGGTLKDFLNSFSTLLKQSSHCQEAEKRGLFDDASILCLDKDHNFLNVYYFFPKRTTSLILPGVIKAAAHILYETEVEVSLMPRCLRNDCSEFVNQPYLLYSVHVKSTKPSLSPGKPPSSLVIPASLFCKTFPFHFMFDKDMMILQFGNGIRRLMSRRDFQGKPNFEEYFEILTPKINQTFSGIMTMLNMQFVIRVRRWDNSVKKSSRVMDLKGQMIYIVESSAILFLGSPCVDRLEDFTGRGLYLSDIPIHNALRDVVLIGEQARAQDGLKKRLGKLKATLEQAHQALEEEKKKTVDLLCSIFPSEVAQQLWQGQVVQAKKFNNVTMLFSDIVGFTAICSQCSPLQVITMLNALYTRFDRQCGELDVYKVETIGDAYCVAGGLHKESDTHAVQIALMALKMMELSDEVMSPHGEPIKMRIGLHSGSVFAGVVGVKMPRYCLFGNNVTLANKFESCSIPRKINVSPTTYRLLKDCPGFVFTPRSREELPPNFPSEIPGICHFLDAYLQGTNSKPWFQKKDNEDGNANFLGKASGID
ncbi:guanylate cyclase soluble subunit alpha-1 isoform X1 [Elephas maximus indicus]|uniref:guanylate cyclase soluble subunit alpha-1 isoform X1 n=1 Tax=Elephas maximus indicus TaxID=99487 RepID=UPI00211647AE|nr:guanylate cyclase soluble subunit alpha-1 isoform X1 [Elephas maximus indicus]XP_049761176.1 guanylate cyclase soluble subunit alpha-1 isoform X1 [Elephas maximus indicus]XP_049761177.1 guanylate cyclase soluble subunit alpha-1 isoform X1 [Elephas maximus indicus]XP_049761178.1 guanylate cyclase soluble subunit alpha-1 isoform X1 [Elephas maximus indicus]XP_049761179.1 guanylate cyclase soluble subunit alpha-1 isoform X1 [Elephas maximus indicus]XP_049761180.1 guanylate cyclase soluble subu